MDLPWGLSCSALHCSAVYCFILHRSVSQISALYCFVCFGLDCVALHCSGLHCSALLSYALPCSAQHCFAVLCFAAADSRFIEASVVMLACSVIVARTDIRISAFSFDGIGCRSRSAISLSVSIGHLRSGSVPDHCQVLCTCGVRQRRAGGEMSLNCCRCFQ